ncbi:hypothetical protein A152_0023080 [Vibrio tasmaniensis 1F-187]|uniref:hypothetical protein n=1 Tax=unclassified Vibrio TaxID=2614977 RepID=UPI0002D55742|nr:hypothetical protein [Vibrio tasmaniensis]OEF69964.1 hypothetical protein A152_17685 [Vibrio tasmaniensis 1F-187]
MNIKESDWKIFCEIKREAAQLFCTRQLDEAIKAITDESESVGERFHFMCEEGLVVPKQFERLSEELKKDITNTLERRA